MSRNGRRNGRLTAILIICLYVAAAVTLLVLSIHFGWTYGG